MGGQKERNTPSRPFLWWCDLPAGAAAAAPPSFQSHSFLLISRPRNLTPPTRTHARTPKKSPSSLGRSLVLPLLFKLARFCRKREEGGDLAAGGEKRLFKCQKRDSFFFLLQESCCTVGMNEIEMYLSLYYSVSSFESPASASPSSWGSSPEESAASYQGKSFMHDVSNYKK